jgi:hypothetical protein
MEHFNTALEHGKGSLLGASISIGAAILGHITLSDTALIFAILSGAATFVYTVYKFIIEVKKNNKK